MSNQNALPDNSLFDPQTIWSSMAGSVTALIMTTTLSIQQSVIKYGSNMEPAVLHLMLSKLSQDAANFVESLSKVCHIAGLQSLNVKIDGNTDFAPRCALCNQTTPNCICKLLHLNRAEETTVVKQMKVAVFEKNEKAVQAMVIDGQLRSCAVADKCEQRTATPDTDNSTLPSEEITEGEVILKLKIMQNSDDTISDSYKTNSNSSESAEEFFTAASTQSFNPPEPHQSESPKKTRVEPEGNDKINEAWRELEHDLKLDNMKNAPEELPDFPTAILKPSFSTILEVDEPSEKSHSDVKKEQTAPSQVAKPNAHQEKEEIIMSFLNLLLKEITSDERKPLTEEKSVETSISLSKPSIHRKRTLNKTIIVEEVRPYTSVEKLRASNTFINEIKSKTSEHKHDVFDKSTNVKTSVVDKTPTPEKQHTIEKKASVHRKKSRVLGPYSDADVYLPEEFKAKSIVKKIISEFSNPGSQHSMANEKVTKRLTIPERLFERIGETSTRRGPSIAEKLFEKLSENSGIMYPKQEWSKRCCTHKLKPHAVAPPDQARVTKRVSFDRSSDNWSTEAFLASVTQTTRSKSSLRRKSKCSCSLGEVGTKHSENSNVMANF